MSDIFLITSVIDTGSIHYTYAPRSVQTAEQRFEQVLQTIQSIRKLKDDTHIFLIEGSPLSASMEETLKRSVDIYMNCSSEPDVVNACLLSNKKGFGEVIQTQIALQKLIDDATACKRLFKISGRQTLNHKFSKDNFSCDLYTFKESIGHGVHSTILQSVPGTKFQEFQKNLEMCRQTYVTTQGPVSFETVVPLYCWPKQVISVVGVEGTIAVDGSFVEA